MTDSTLLGGITGDESLGLVQNWRKLQALLDFGFGALSTLMIHFGHPST